MPAGELVLSTSFPASWVLGPSALALDNVPVLTKATVRTKVAPDSDAIVLRARMRCPLEVLLN